MTDRNIPSKQKLARALETEAANVSSMPRHWSQHNWEEFAGRVLAHLPHETKAEHICGAPDAMCDAGCMERAYRHDEGTANLMKEQLVQYLRVSAYLADSVAPRDGVAYVRADCLRQAIDLLTSAVLTIKFRPLLVSGSYGESPNGAVILIDSEQPPEQQITTLWHEVLHLVLAALGKAHDENWIETMALRFAAACPDLLTQPRATVKSIAPPASDKCEHGIPRRFCTAMHGVEKQEPLT